MIDPDILHLKNKMEKQKVINGAELGEIQKATVLILSGAAFWSFFEWQPWVAGILMAFVEAIRTMHRSANKKRARALRESDYPSYRQAAMAMGLEQFKPLFGEDEELNLELEELKS